MPERQLSKRKLFPIVFGSALVERPSMSILFMNLRNLFYVIDSDCFADPSECLQNLLMETVFAGSDIVYDLLLFAKEAVGSFHDFQLFIHICKASGTV